jgi:hypothetical protein
MKTSKKIIGTLAIPVIVAAVLLILCAANGKSMIANRTSFNFFTLYAAIVMIILPLIYLVTLLMEFGVEFFYAALKSLSPVTVLP